MAEQNENPDRHRCKDFEDALQAASALSFGAAFIVTRNLAHYKTSPVPALSPVQFVARLKSE